MVQGVGRREILYGFEDLGLGFRVQTFVEYEIRCMCGAKSLLKRHPVRLRGLGLAFGI